MARLVTYLDVDVDPTLNDPEEVVEEILAWAAAAFPVRPLHIRTANLVSAEWAD